MSAFRSVRLRLVGIATVVVVSMMIVTGFVLTLLLERNIERRVGQELDAHLQQIIGGLRFERDGTIKLTRDLTDPRFGEVFGGLYYQVSTLSGDVLLKSRSLWDAELEPPEDVIKLGEIHVHDGLGPSNTTLLLHESWVIFPLSGQQLPLLVTVGIDRTELMALKSGFTKDLVLALAVLAIALLVGFAFQISVGIRPLVRLRDGIADVKAGKSRRLSTDAPSEVTPLIDEVNSLLDQQDESMIRARDRAADLAHGLKTPLTALGSDIARLRKLGVTEIADDIQELSARMRRHLDRELALARDRHGRANARTLAKPTFDAIIRTLEKTPKGEHLKFINTVSESIELAVDHNDFLEIAGNLLENASNFATNTISIECTVHDGWASFIINDDGPGVVKTRIAHITKRGVRLDTTGAGSGLGLAIVNDIVDAYAGQIRLENRHDKGLSAIVILPVAPPQNSQDK